MVPFIIYSGIILTLPFIFSAPNTAVILLDNNKSKNGVVVSTQAGTTDLNTPYTQTALSRADAKPEPISSIDPIAVAEKYADVLEALPLVPQSFLFYFEDGSAQLSSESKGHIPKLIEVIKGREPSIVDIIGHTDTEGSDEANYELGLARAMMVKLFLDEQQVNLGEVNVESYGEKNPLIMTEDNVNEPRNRRVEVRVR